MGQRSAAALSQAHSKQAPGSTETFLIGHFTSALSHRTADQRALATAIQIHLVPCSPLAKELPVCTDKGNIPLFLSALQLGKREQGLTSELKGFAGTALSGRQEAALCTAP